MMSHTRSIVCSFGGVALICLAAACDKPAEAPVNQAPQTTTTRTAAQQEKAFVATTPTGPVRPWLVEMREGKPVVLLEDLNNDEFKALEEEEDGETIERAVPARHKSVTEWTLFSSSGGAPIKAKTRSFAREDGANTHLIATIEPESALPPESLLLAVKGHVSLPKARIAPLGRATLDPDKARIVGDVVRAEITHQMPDHAWPETVEQGTHFALYKADGVSNPAGVIVVKMRVPEKGEDEPAIEQLSALFLADETMRPAKAIMAPAIRLDFYEPVALEDLDGDGTYRLIYHARYYEGDFIFLNQPNDKGGFTPIVLGGDGA